VLHYINAVILLAGNHKQMSTSSKQRNIPKSATNLQKEIVAAKRNQVISDKGPFTISPAPRLAVSYHGHAAFNGRVPKN